MIWKNLNQGVIEDVSMGTFQENKIHSCRINQSFALPEIQSTWKLTLHEPRAPWTPWKLWTLSPSLSAVMDELNIRHLIASQRWRLLLCHNIAPNRWIALSGVTFLCLQRQNFHPQGGFFKCFFILKALLWTFCTSHYCQYVPFTLLSARI